MLSAIFTNTYNRLYTHIFTTPPFKKIIVIKSTDDKSVTVKNRHLRSNCIVYKNITHTKHSGVKRHHNKIGCLPVCIEDQISQLKNQNQVRRKPVKETIIAVATKSVSKQIKCYLSPSPCL